MAQNIEYLWQDMNKKSNSNNVLIQMSILMFDGVNKLKIWNE